MLFVSHCLLKSGSVNGKTYDVLLTTSGEIELETRLAGGVSGSLSGNMALYTMRVHERNSQNAQRFVAEHAKGTLPEIEVGKSVSIADEIEKLAKLKNSGSITQDEFEMMKKQVLGLS